MLAVLAPGQGAQTPGLLAPWLDLPDAPARLRWWSGIAGVDLVAAGTMGDPAAIRDTAVAQPLLVAAGLLAAEALGALDPVGVVAGHSVGEITAAALAGALTPETAIALSARRGRAMATAAARLPTGMCAVLGGDDVLEHLDRLGLTPANVNGAGQVVAAGTREQLAALALDPPAHARLRPLAVAGAFHTAHMRTAGSDLASVIDGVTVRDPQRRVLSNADGTVVTSGDELLRRLVVQVASPVRWDRCQETLTGLGVTAVIELPPAGTLTGLARRVLPGVETLALRTPGDLDAARALLAACAPGHEPVPAWRLVVAPESGTFHPIPAVPGAGLAPGQPVGTVRHRTHETAVVAAHGGVLVEWLADEGDPVSPGQPLARLHPEAFA